MMLIYSKRAPDMSERNYNGHRALMEEAAREGIFVAAEPLAPLSTATTIRLQNGVAIVSDGPFAETKEQLAGYYILDCADLQQAIEWASKIPHACTGADSVEIRALPGIPEP
jgi:hypothetical protein